MTLDLQQSLEPHTLSINLEGEGCVPQIRILEPAPSDQDDPTIDFGLSFLSKPREKMLVVQNIGKVVAHLTAEIVDNPNEVYSIYLEKDKNKLSCGCMNTENGLSTPKWIYSPFVKLLINFVASTQIRVMSTF